MVTQFPSLPAMVKSKVMKSLSEIIDNEWKHGHDSKFRFSIPDAKKWLSVGLRYFLGQQAYWLPEYDHVVQWMEKSEGRGLMCIGDCGRGKSLITQKILPMVFRECLNRHYQTHTAIDLLDDYDTISRPNVIFLDDVGTEPDARHYGMTHNYFSELVDLCERNDKMLITSTNLSKDELISRYGMRTFDRLTAITTRVYFEGGSLRK